MKCIECGRPIYEDQSAEFHYTEPSKVCMHCEIKKKAPKGTMLQDAKGNYYIKD